MSLLKASVRIQHASLGGDGANVWHLRTTGSDPQEAFEVNGLMDIIKGFYSDCSASLPDTAVLTWDGVATGFGPDEGETFNGTPWTFTGTQPGQALPPANCICIGWRTSSGGRMGRGRTFLGPISQAANESDGTIATTHLNLVRAAAVELVADSMGFANGAIGVWSEGRSGHDTLPDAPAAFRDVTGSAVRDQFAVLRSRRD